MKTMGRLLLKFLCVATLVCWVGRDLTWAKGEGLGFLSPPSEIFGIETPLSPNESARILITILPEQFSLTLVTHQRAFEMTMPKWMFYGLLTAVSLWISVSLLFAIAILIDVPHLKTILETVLIVLLSVGSLVVVTDPAKKQPPTLKIERIQRQDQVHPSMVFL